MEKIHMRKEMNLIDFCPTNCFLRFLKETFERNHLTVSKFVLKFERTDFQNKTKIQKFAAYFLQNKAEMAHFNNWVITLATSCCKCK